VTVRCTLRLRMSELFVEVLTPCVVTCVVPYGVGGRVRVPIAVRVPRRACRANVNKVISNLSSVQAVHISPYGIRVKL
jgi:hypothetical protein